MAKRPKSISELMSKLPKSRKSKIQLRVNVLKDAVNHPGHYGGKSNPYETIKVLENRLTREEFIGAMKFNVYKYNDRAKLKGDELENYEKAAFYQNYLVSYLKKN